MGAEGERHDDLDDGDGGESDGDRDHAAPYDQSDGDTESESESGVTDRYDATRAEDRRDDPREVEEPGLGAVGNCSVNRTRPPGDRQAEQPGDGHRGQAGETQLGSQPAMTGDALVPHQPVGAGLQFASYQWRAPEGADDGRGGVDERLSGDVQELVDPVDPDPVEKIDLVGVVEIQQVWAGDRHHD